MDDPGGSSPEIAVLLACGSLPAPAELAGQGAGRVYAGHEFCERLLPDKEHLARVLEQAGKAGVRVTLVTPFLSENGIRALGDLLAAAAKAGCPNLEVVFNDWGTCELLGAFPRFKRTLGRLLCAKHVRGGEFPASFVDLLLAEQVSAVEFNFVRQLKEARDQLTARAIKTHFYYPFAYLTATRLCTSVSPGGGYFRDSIVSCSKECLKLRGEVRYRNKISGQVPSPAPRSPGSVLESEIMARGNAWFMKLGELPCEPWFRPDRIVLDQVYFGEPGGRGTGGER